MNSIFKNAYFGRRYKTRDNRKFVFLGEVKSLFGHYSAIQGLIEDDDTLAYYNSEGKSLYCEYKGSAINACDIDFNQVNCEEDCETDIVSEWQISEEELDRLAKEEYSGPLNWPDEYHNGRYVIELVEAYKVGFSKALEYVGSKR